MGGGWVNRGGRQMENSMKGGQWTKNGERMDGRLEGER